MSGGHTSDPHAHPPPMYDPSPFPVGAICATAVVVLFTVALMFAILASLERPMSEADNAKCKSNLKNIGTAAVGLYVQSQGRPPTAGGIEFFNLLYATNTLTDPMIYICPSDESGDNERTRNSGLAADECSYWGRRVPYKVGSASTTPVAADETVRYHRTNVNALYLDGHVETVPLRNGTTDPLTTPPFAGTLGD